MHVFVDPTAVAAALIRILGQLAVRPVHGEIAQRDERRPMDREHVRVATIGVIAVTLARGVRVECQRARAVGGGRRGLAAYQGVVFGVVQGGVVWGADGDV